MLAKCQKASLHCTTSGSGSLPSLETQARHQVLSQGKSRLLQGLMHIQHSLTAGSHKPWRNSDYHHTIQSLYRLDDFGHFHFCGCASVHHFDISSRIGRKRTADWMAVELKTSRLQKMKMHFCGGGQKVQQERKDKGGRGRMLTFL